jgi:toxin YoeB
MSYTVKFLESAKKDYLHWESHNPRMTKKIDELEEALKQDPFKGIGKPKPLRHWPNTWSRRITEEHRIIYQVRGNLVVIIRCFGHYE